VFISFDPENLLLADCCKDGNKIRKCIALGAVFVTSWTTNNSSRRILRCRVV